MIVANQDSYYRQPFGELWKLQQYYNHVGFHSSSHLRILSNKAIQVTFDPCLSVRLISHTMVMILFLIPEHHMLSIYIYSIQYVVVLCYSSILFQLISLQDQYIYYSIKQVCSDYSLVSNFQPI